MNSHGQNPARFKIERTLAAHYDKINDMEWPEELNNGHSLINDKLGNDSQQSETVDEGESERKLKEHTWKICSTQSILFATFFCLVRGAVDSTISYLSVYYEQLGLDVTQIGILTSVQSWVAIPWTPFIGYLADRFSIRKLFLCLSLGGSAIDNWGLYFVPKIDPVDCNLLANRCKASSQLDSKDQTDQLYNVEHVISPVTSNSSFPALLSRSDSKTLLYRGYLFDTGDLFRVFTYLVVVNIISQLVCSAYYPLGNAEVLDGLGEEGRNQYGYYRAIGGMSGALSIWVTGHLLDLTKRDVVICGLHVISVNYIVCFGLFSTLMLLSVPVAIAMSPKKMNRSAKKYHYIKAVRSLCNLRYGSVVLVIMWVAIVTSKMRTFDFWYIEILGGSHSLMAWCGLVGQFSMVGTCLVLPIVNDNFGHLPVVIFSCASIAVGCFVNAFIQNPVWMILPIFLREMSLAVSIQASAAYLSEAVESHEMATLQTIIASLTFGVGRGVGSLLGGNLFQAITPAQSYYFFGLVSSGLGIFQLIVYLTI